MHQKPVELARNLKFSGKTVKKDMMQKRLEKQYVEFRKSPHLDCKGRGIYRHLRMRRGKGKGKGESVLGFRGQTTVHEGGRRKLWRKIDDGG